MIVLVLSVLLKLGNAEVNIISSALNNYTCRGNHVSFYCNGTGQVDHLVWRLDGFPIHIYNQNTPGNTLMHRATNSFSAFFPNVSMAYVSELIFITLPPGESFSVQCSFGSESNVVKTSIVGEPTAPVLNSYITTNTSVMEVSWMHNSSFLLYYRVELGDVMFEVRDTSITLTLPSCTTFNLQVTTVDVCNNEAAATSQIICERTGRDPSLAQQMFGDVTVQPMREEAIYKMVVTLVVLVVFMFAGQLTAILYCICSCFCGRNKCKDSNQCGSSKNKCKAKVFWLGRTESSEVQPNVEGTKIPL